MTIHPEVDCDLERACCHLREADPDLAEGFLQLYKALLLDIARNPLRWRDHGDGIRKALIHRFHYTILYQVLGQEVFVGAVIHQARDERAWRHRFD